MIDYQHDCLLREGRRAKPARTAGITTSPSIASGANINTLGRPYLPRGMKRPPPARPSQSLPSTIKVPRRYTFSTPGGCVPRAACSHNCRADPPHGWSVSRAGRTTRCRHRCRPRSCPCGGTARTALRRVMRTPLMTLNWKRFSQSSSVISANGLGFAVPTPRPRCAGVTADRY
jgi:hypothetical protein